MPHKVQDEDAGSAEKHTTAGGLNLVGLGLRVGHMTREVEDVLAHCSHVYYLHGDPETVKLLECRAQSLTDISTFYETGTSRLETYYRIATHLIFRASCEPPIGVALYGHPTVFSTLSSMLIAGSRRFGIGVSVFPGVSSIDAILATLGIDPGGMALQVHEATELLAFARPLDRHSGLLVFQAGQVGTRIHTPTGRSCAHLRQLARRLADTYGSGHEVTAMELEAGSPGWTWRGSIDDLPAAAESFSPHFTIYVPPSERPPVRDPAILRGLDEVPKIDLVLQ
jgi:tetrapyrrole methylase family protein / MazG family protein